MDGWIEGERGGREGGREAGREVGIHRGEAGGQCCCGFHSFLCRTLGVKLGSACGVAVVGDQLRSRYLKLLMLKMFLCSAVILTGWLNHPTSNRLGGVAHTVTQQKCSISKNSLRMVLLFEGFVKVRISLSISSVWKVS
jgi:hypothetical protein